MKTLHLILKRKWFDMIQSGEKREEYREIKPYWWMRLVQCGEIYGMDQMDESGSLLLPPDQWKMIMAKRFDTVTFRNGYGKSVPEITLPIESITIGEGKPEWGAEPGKKYFVIKFKEQLSLI